MAFVLKQESEPGAPLDPARGSVPQAPGAVWSPQVPGQVPDRSTVPGEGDLPVAVPETPPRLPLTEYGTSQRIMRVFAPEDGNEDDPARFEQAPVSYEEQRKAMPALRSPLRPQPGYALSAGVRLSTGPTPALADAGDEGELPPGM